MNGTDLGLEKSRTVDGWMMAMMIAVVIAYGWMTAAVLEPKFPLPNKAISSLVWVEGSTFKDWREIRKSRSLALARIAREVQQAEREIALLGGFPETPSLVIVSDDRTRYVVSDTRIEIAESIAMARGQLRKALIKSWLLQTQPNANPIATRSILRLEVVSDTLEAMLSSDIKFGTLDDVSHVEIPEPASWPRFAGSLDALCGSPWASLDLQGKCGNSKRIHPLSFRPLLAGMIWSTFQSVPTFRRFDLLRAWAAELQVPSPRETKDDVTPKTLNAWGGWLLSEYREIFPVEALALRAGLSDEDRARLLEAARKVETVAELSKVQHVSIDSVFNSDRALIDTEERVRPPLATLGSYVIINGDKGARLFPGDVDIEKADLARLSTPLMVWENCKSATIGALLDHPVKADRYLHVLSCRIEERMSSWNQLVRRGLSAFATARTDVEFIQLHRDNVERAIRHRALSRRALISSLMKSGEHEAGSPLLGLDRSKWRPDMGAYRVLGAIEAIEWYRSSEIKPPHAAVF